jgi:hypothetical protein
MRRIGEWRYSPTTLTLTLDEYEWSALRPGRFIPRGKSILCHSIGSRVEHEVGVYTVEKFRILHLQGFESRSFSP